MAVTGFPASCPSDVLFVIRPEGKKGSEPRHWGGRVFRVDQVTIQVVSERQLSI